MLLVGRLCETHRAKEYGWQLSHIDIGNFLIKNDAVDILPGEARESLDGLYKYVDIDRLSIADPHSERTLVYLGLVWLAQGNIVFDCRPCFRLASL